MTVLLQVGVFLSLPLKGENTSEFTAFAQLAGYLQSGLV
jgi:hypothetical protein